MRIGKIELKKIIIEEIKKALKEGGLPPISHPVLHGGQSRQRPPAPNIDYDTGKMTRQEIDQEFYIYNMLEWGKQLTTVEYRQFLQDCGDAIGYNTPLYEKIRNATANAIGKKGNIKDALFLDSIYNGREGPRIQRYLTNSGYDDDKMTKG